MDMEHGPETPVGAPSDGGPENGGKKPGFLKKLSAMFIPKKGDSARTLTSKIIALVAAVVVVAALVMGGLLLHKYIVKNIELEKAKGLYPSSSETSSDSDGEVPDNVWNPEDPDLDPELGISTDFLELHETNKDVVGYLEIPDTKLSMPVVQGDDNEYYLDHTLEKKYNPFGIPFADHRVTFSPNYQSDNVTIYGHAAKDGTFFAPVKEYKDIEFYKKHPTLTFDTIYGKGLYKIVGVMMVDTDITKKDLFNFHDYNDMSEEQFDYFMDQVYKRTYFNTDVDVKFGDNLLTLSTCDTDVINSNTTPYRMALVARKVRPGEVMDVDVSKAEINKDVTMPDGWIKKFGKQTPFDK